MFFTFDNGRLFVCSPNAYRRSGDGESRQCAPRMSKTATPTACSISEI
jgi:hypothetical protein